MWGFIFLQVVLNSCRGVFNFRMGLLNFRRGVLKVTGGSLDFRRGPKIQEGVLRLQDFRRVGGKKL